MWRERTKNDIIKPCSNNINYKLLMKRKDVAYGRFQREKDRSK
mgnify:CR=1 FL=1|jgi:hypothetical protein